MSDNIAIERLVQRAYVYLARGSVENASLTLEELQARDAHERREAAYTRACHLVQREQWDEAGQNLLSVEVSGEHVSDLATLGRTERRRRVYYLLVLGDVALTLERLEEATHHYTQCIKLLDKRRMNDVTIRVRALRGLGVTATALGSPVSALTFYEKALALCGEQRTHIKRADILAGLCVVHRHLGDLERALHYGREALQFYRAHANTLQMCQMHTLLGCLSRQVNDSQGASVEYTEALTLALSAQHTGMILDSLVALVDLRLEEERLEEAWGYCECALDIPASVPRSYADGLISLMCGKVAQAQVHNAEGRLAQELIEVASALYCQAVDAFTLTGDTARMADVYGRLAQLLEVAGRQDLALAYWRSAYTARRGSEEPPLM